MDSVAYCQLLEWDSDFFGVTVARVIPARLEASTMAEALEWCRSQAVDCLYYLCPSDDPESIRAAEANAFQLTDIRLTLHRALAGQPGNQPPFSSHIRPARDADLPALKDIARTSYHDSRFYHDPHFAAGRADALYETWIERSCHGYADAVLVADDEGAATGYITCSRAGDGRGEIGLLGVNRSHRGRGLGQRLVQASFDWFLGQHCHEVVVVTQGRNVAAQRLYQRNGFVTQAVQLWYHRWFDHHETSEPGPADRRRASPAP